jgi:hypothetical protein
MKINTNTQIKLVAHVTLSGLESLERGQIDLQDPRLNGSPGTVQLELHTDEETAVRMEIETGAARAIFGAEAALHYLDDKFINPWRVQIAMVTTGDPAVDRYTQDQARSLGRELSVATSIT